MTQDAASGASPGGRQAATAQSASAPREDEPVLSGNDADPDLERREVLAALAAFSACVAPASLVLLDADTAYAKQSCSRHPKPQAGQNCEW